MVVASPSVKRILVIDDNFCTREAMSMLLAGQGYQVAAAANGADALEWLRTFDRPDLILLDLRMPIMDGQTFCEKLRQQPGLEGIPLVVLSATADCAEKASDLGAARYLHKPVDTIQLLQTVQECWSGAKQPG
jgi:CheY-like chemotaxis protein